MADCTHQLDLCPDCEGLRVTRLDRLPGVSSIETTGADSSITYRGAVRVYVGPVPGPCPNPLKETNRGQ